LQDFSERFVRIEMTKENKLLPLLDEGSNVVLRIDLSSGEEAMILRGTVFRRRKNSIIITLQNLMKNGKFLLIDEIDELFIKAAMLGHPKTERH